MEMAIGDTDVPIAIAAGGLSNTNSWNVTIMSAAQSFCKENDDQPDPSAPKELRLRTATSTSTSSRCTTAGA